MKETMSSVRYCFFTILALVLLLLGVMAFNAVVDPFGMYRFIEIRGFNSHKPAVYHRVRLFKAYDVRRIKPSAIILGTSRTHLGINPSHGGWAPDSLPAYNLAFDGATTKEMFLFLKHAHAVKPIKQVVLGLDSYHATDAPGSTRPDFDPQVLLGSKSAFQHLKILAADLKILTSIDTLFASLKTLRSQGDDEPEWFAVDGQRLGEVFFRSAEATFIKKGPRAYFEEVDKREVGFKTEKKSSSSGKQVNQAFAPAAAEEETSLDYIRRIIEFCRAEQIDLRIFITPEHAHQMELTSTLGQWGSVENAKRGLVGLLSEDAARHPEDAPIPLYDFSGYSSITTESLPRHGSRDEMQYYWDSSHFKEVVGDLVLDRLFGTSHPGHFVPDDFGVRLTEDTIESALARIRLDQTEYRRSHPADIASLRMLVTMGTKNRGCQMVAGR
jgi:hypothetical protein